MATQVYRLTTDTSAVMVMPSGKKELVRIPAGGVITHINGSRKSHPVLVEVLWDGQTVRIFRQDLERRGEMLSSAGH